MAELSGKSRVRVKFMSFFCKIEESICLLDFSWSKIKTVEHMTSPIPQMQNGLSLEDYV